MSKLVAAIPYGTDGLTGDSLYYPRTEETDTQNYINLTKLTLPDLWVLRKTQIQQTLLQNLLTLWKNKNPEIEPKDHPTGFWLLTTTQLKALTRFQNALPEAANDGLCYSNNRATKTFITAISQLTIGQKPWEKQ